MKKIIVLLITFLLIFICQKSYSQVPHIEWQRCFGGSGNEYIRDLFPTKDGNFIVLGTTTSTNGDVEPRSRSNQDAWVLKFNKNGNVIWSKTLFNNGRSYGIAVAGNETESEDLLISTFVSEERWGFKLNKNGTTKWSRPSLPLVSLQLLKDFESDKFLGINNKYNVNRQNSSDFTLVKIDTSGLGIFENNYGGNKDEAVYSITKTTDNCYILTGWTKSNNSGDVGINTAREFTPNIWVVKVNATGNLIWEKSLGKSGVPELGYSVVSNGEGGCVIAGTFFPSTYDGISDIGLYNIDRLGNIVWQKSYGGTGSERPSCIAKDIDGGYVITATTTSNNGDVSGNHGGQNDGWLLKVDKNGSLLWQICLGGSDEEGLNKVYITPSGDYIVAGYTKSNDGDVSGYNGSNTNQEWGDFWVLRLSYSYCSNSQNISYSITNSQNFKTNGFVLADNSITNTGNVIFNAKNHILLNPGFEVVQNGKFLAVIDGCDN